MDEHCYFAKEPPSVEIRGGLVFLRPAGSHSEVCFTPHTLQLFMERCAQVLSDWREGSEPIVQLERHG